MKHSEEIYGRARRVASENLRLLDRLFADHSDVVEWIRPRGGMIAFPSLTNGADTRPFCRRLANKGVLIAPGDCFGQPSHFRVGFAASGERFPLAAERFEEFLQEESGRAH